MRTSPIYLDTPAEDVANILRRTFDGDDGEQALWYIVVQVCGLFDRYDPEDETQAGRRDVAIAILDSMGITSMPASVDAISAMKGIAPERYDAHQLSE